MKRSAGLLMFRRRAGGIEVLLAKPGGPWWRGKDAGAWTLPKGEYEDPEDALDAARREWGEETGFPATGPFLPLGEIVQKAGKHVQAWAFEGDCDPAAMTSNTFEMEWPPRSGRRQSFPEIEAVRWFGLDAAHVQIIAAQGAFLDRLEAALR